MDEDLSFEIAMSIEEIGYRETNKKYSALYPDLRKEIEGDLLGYLRMEVGDSMRDRGRPPTPEEFGKN